MLAVGFNLPRHGWSKVSINCYALQMRDAGVVSDA